jgi:NAD(P)H-nitrite reductase large subunit
MASHIGKGRRTSILQNGLANWGGKARDSKVKSMDRCINTNANHKIDSDFIALGTGVRPNSEVARDAGIEIGYARIQRV